MRVLKSTPVEFVKIQKLRFNHVGKSITEGEYQLLKEEVRESGMSKPLLVERITNKVLSGNLLLLIAFELGLTHLPVVYMDLNSSKYQELRSVA
jgi:hypothetical protein